MKRFRFQLDSLLKVREARENEARRELADLLRQQREIEDRIRRQQDHLAEGRETMRASVQGKVDLVTMRAAAHSSMQVMREANRLVLQLAGFQWPGFTEELLALGYDEPELPGDIVENAPVPARIRFRASR